MAGANKVPYPSVNFPNIVKEAMKEGGLPLQTMEYNHSGEFTSSLTNVKLGTVIGSGNLADFVISVIQSGRDGVDTLRLSGTLKKNGVSVGTAATIDGASGEASAASVSSAITFSTESVVRGDRLTMDLTLTRTTPVTEMSGIFAAVKIVPVIT